MKKTLKRIISGLGLMTLIFVSTIPVAQAETEAGIMTVTLTRTDNLGPKIYVGDRMTFTVTYTNNTDKTITAFPKDSNLEGMLTNSTPNCRWSGLPPRATKQCTSAYHIVTEEDVRAGRFVPSSEWKATKDRNGNIVLQDGIKADGEEATTVEGQRPPESQPEDPLTTPHDYEIGEKVRLAQPGDAGYTCHRIPALTTANNGWIIAAWDGRPNGCADAPQANSIIYRISKDGGKSWTPIKTALAGKTSPNHEKYGYSDPSFVVDRNTGHIFLFSVKSYDQGIRGSQLGTDPNNRNILHASVVESHDNGETWTNQRVITDQVSKGHENEWRGRFAASGEGIQLRYGPHAGRLIQQYAIFRANESVLYAHSVYSDDHGKTWQPGGLSDPYADENKVVELSDGTLMLNSRSSNGAGFRYVALSTDQGETWGNFRKDTTLVDPVNNASIIRAYPNAPIGSMRAKILLFSNAKNPSSWQRSNGYVRISYDDGATWTEGRQFEPGAMAYSTLTTLGENKWGMLYESGGYKNIEFMTIDKDWLGLKDPGPDAMDPIYVLNQTRKELQESQAQLNAAEHKITELSDKVTALQNDKNATVAEKEAAREELAKAQADLAKERQAKEKLSEKVASLTSDLANERENSARTATVMEQEIAELKAKLADALAENEAQKAQASSDKAELELKLNEEKNKNTALNSENEELKQQLAAAKAHISELEDKMAKKENCQADTADKQNANASSPINNSGIGTTNISSSSTHSNYAPVLNFLSRLNTKEKTNTFMAGEMASAHYSGFIPGEKVNLELHSEVVKLPSQVADKNGNLIVNFLVPKSFKAGEIHNLVALGEITKTEIRGQFKVLGQPQQLGAVKNDSDKTQLAKTGSFAYTVLAGLLCIAGGVMISTRKKRKLK